MIGYAHLLKHPILVLVLQLQTLILPYQIDGVAQGIGELVHIPDNLAIGIKFRARAGLVEFGL